MSMNSKYYTDNYEMFIENTFNCDMSNLYDYFLKYMNKSGKILDLGFGSGRDLIFFSKLGYSVVGIDPVELFVSRMKDKGYEVYLRKVEDMGFLDEFDGIWACASLLHVSKDSLEIAFNKCAMSLKDRGILYCSFKYGTFEGERNGRYFMDLTEDLIKEYIVNTKLVLLDTMITTDVRPDREEKWLNCIFMKK